MTKRLDAAPNYVVPRRPDVTVVEVGPRDGLQNEPAQVPTATKVAFINALAASGVPIIEATSFVNPKAVPQLADAAEVMSAIDRPAGIRFPVLVPNEKGLSRALEAGVGAIALFTAATDAFAQANVGTDIAGTIERFRPVVELARARGIWVRGYISVAFGCPYSGDVFPQSVADVTQKLDALGCAEICLADTIGVASPESVRTVLGAVTPVVPTERLALHFHDTSGRAIANVEEALQHDIRTFDSAAGGLGGCPFAPGAPGNLATERLVGRLDALGLDTGIDLARIADAVALLRPHVSRLSA